MTDTTGPEFIPVDHELAVSVFETYDEGDPRFCAYRWWVNLLHRNRWMWALVAGTVPGREDYWGDYTAAAAYLDGWSLGSEVHATDRDDVRRLHFVELTGDQVPATDSAFISKAGEATVRFMNLVRCSDGTWRAWSLGPLDLDEIRGVP
jgi:hypothetical protein